MTKDKVVCLVSGGIDSPVACTMVTKKFRVVPLHFCLYPLASEESSLRAVKILEELKEEIGFEKVIVFPWAGILSTIRSEIEDEYACVACRKSMLRAAESVCKQEGARGIVTGESLGQKASQTLSNINATSFGINYPILRPLLGLDKKEIITKSKELGIWHAQHAGCCLATPQGPKTKVNPQVVEKKLDRIKLPKLIQEGFNSSLELRTFEENFEEFLFELAGKFG